MPERISPAGARCPGQQVARLAAMDSADQGLLVVEPAQEQQLFPEGQERLQHLSQFHLCPTPLAHHSLLWNPFPANRQAKRTGGCEARCLQAFHRPKPRQTPTTATPSLHQRRGGRCGGKPLARTAFALLLGLLFAFRYGSYLPATKSLPRIIRNCGLRTISCTAQEIRPWFLSSSDTIVVSSGSSDSVTALPKA